MVALNLLANILGKRKDISLSAVTVDEGIAGYRESSIPIVARVCRDLRIEHLKISLRELFGVTVDQIAGLDRPLSTCSYCGVMRRSAMNRAARDWRATHLATGLNLDDTAQSIMMSFARGDVERLARLGPHSRVQEGLVPRLQPLRSIPESETTLYAIINEIPFHDLECRYAEEAMRNQYRDLMFRLEENSPGTRHSMIRSYDEIRPLLVAKYPPSRLRTCACGEPAIGDQCKACELLESLKSSSQI